MKRLITLTDDANDLGKFSFVHGLLAEGDWENFRRFWNGSGIGKMTTELKCQWYLEIWRSKVGFY